MKRTLCLSALFVVCATIAVSGQSMNEKLQQLLGGSHSAKQEEATPPTYPSEEALLGVWTYQAPSIEYKGDDMFASIAVAGLQDQLATPLRQGRPRAGTGDRFLQKTQPAPRLYGRT